MVVPKLRFREFSGEWVEQTLGDISYFLDNKRIPLSEIERTVRKGKYPYYGASGIIDYIDDFIFDGEYILLGEDGANILTRSTRLAFVISGKCWINNHAHVIQAKGSPYFLAEALERINYEQYNSGTVQPKLNIKSCLGIKLKNPELKEQTKIANFLSAVDKRIQQVSQTHKLLTQYKKGIMQKIFSQELRFKDENGEAFGEWEYIDLKEIAAKVNIKNRDNLVNTVLTNSATQGIVSQNSYFEREIVTESNLAGYYVVSVGDFVYNPRISATAPVGPIKMNELSKGIMSPLYTVFRFKKGLLKFYQYFFESSVWHDYMKSVANSGARHDRMNISGTDFFTLPVPQPIEDEQTKIANFLSAIDDKINQAQSQLTALQDYKRGLLQQMFI